MRAVIQAVEKARCTVEGRTTGEIEKGLLVYFGVGKGDSEEMLDAFLSKIVNLRIYRDERERANFSVRDTGGSILFISQFTLLASLRKGNRPSFDNAESPEKAEKIYLAAIRKLRDMGMHVETGEFGAHMEISYTNMGPQTFFWEITPQMK